MIRDQFSLCMDNEIIVDLFAGGGGMSCAIEMALGRHSDVSVNHNDDAVSMHTINHPQSRHYRADVFEVCPHEATDGRPVGLLHLSPDCTHHSQAAGGQPRDVKIRALAWVGKRWAGQVLPRVITLENVKQILQWGPLVAKRCKKTGRVMRLDGTVANPGERVPINEQYLIPDKKHAGRTWKRFVSDLKALGYDVKWFMLNAADFGAATTRERLFMCARRDGKPIEPPKPTHFKEPKKGQRGWRPAAGHIDWSIPCPSIFGRKKPLADATMRRIAKGMDKFVLNNASPFIVPIANWSGESVQDAGDPLRTITAWPKGGHFAVAAPTMVQVAHGDGKPGGAQRWGSGTRDIQQPTYTVTASGSGGYALATAFLAQANGGFNTTVGRELDEPATTLTATGSQQQLVAATLAHLRGNCDARDPADPLMTVSAGGQHHGIIAASLQRQFGNSVGQKVDEPVGTIMTGGGGKTALVECTLSKEQQDGALRCASFLISYYGTDNMRGLDEPAATFTTRDRLALVTVWIKGEPWVIVDIGLRMLTPRELYNCQGFPPDYIIDRGHDGRQFTKSAQVRMVGNSVSPPPAMALIKANCMDMASWTLGELKQRERIAA
ncbi:modification methylase [Aquitalea magnusonii]|nr:modification methylase [Aquitalea magnusonii]